MPIPVRRIKLPFPGGCVPFILFLAVVLCSGCRRSASRPVQSPKSAAPDPEILATDNTQDEFDSLTVESSSWLESTRSPEECRYSKSWTFPKDVAWSTQIEGRGHSSPLVVEDLLIVTSADEEKQRQLVIGLDRKTGMKTWSVTAHEGQFPASNLLHDDSSHASCTPVSDGKKVIVVFLRGDAINVTALSLAGEILWQTVAGQFSPYMGYASSPLLAGGKVVVSADDGDGGFIAALDERDGRILWRRPRAKGISHSSPVAGKINGVAQIILSGLNRTAGYSFQTGDELWSAEGPSETTVGTVAVRDGLVFASGGYPEQAVICIEPKRTPDRWDANVLWKTKQKVYVPSLLATAYGLVGLADNGVLMLWDLKTGNVLQRLRLGGDYFASPVIKNETIYVVSRDGNARVLQGHEGQFEIVSDIPMEGEVLSTPAFCAGEIYFRITRHTNAGSRQFVECVRAMPEDASK